MGIPEVGDGFIECLEILRKQPNGKKQINGESILSDWQPIRDKLKQIFNDYTKHALQHDGEEAKPGLGTKPDQVAHHQYLKWIDNYPRLLLVIESPTEGFIRSPEHQKQLQQLIEKHGRLQLLALAALMDKLLGSPDITEVQRKHNNDAFIRGLATLQSTNDYATSKKNRKAATNTNEQPNLRHGLKQTLWLLTLYNQKPIAKTTTQDLPAWLEDAIFGREDFELFCSKRNAQPVALSNLHINRDTDEHSSRVGMVVDRTSHITVQNLKGKYQEPREVFFDKIADLLRELKKEFS